MPHLLICHICQFTTFVSRHPGTINSSCVGCSTMASASTAHGCYSSLAGFVLQFSTSLIIDDWQPIVHQLQMKILDDQGCALVLHTRVTSVALCSRKARAGHSFGQVGHFSIIWFKTCLDICLLSCLKKSTNNNNFNTERVDELMINCCLWTRWGTTQ